MSKLFILCGKSNSSKELIKTMLLKEKNFEIEVKPPTEALEIRNSDRDNVYILYSYINPITAWDRLIQNDIDNHKDKVSIFVNEIMEYDTSDFINKANFYTEEEEPIQNTVDKIWNYILRQLIKNIQIKICTNIKKHI